MVEHGAAALESWRQLPPLPDLIGRGGKRLQQHHLVQDAQAFAGQLQQRLRLYSAAAGELATALCPQFFGGKKRA